MVDLRVSKTMFLFILVCRDCLGRTPFASVIATILCCVGVGLFCGALFRAIDITVRGVFRDLFSLNVVW